MKSLDPVDVLELPGELVASIPCPFMLARPGPGRARDRCEACGEQALLYRYPDPYGYRSRCELGHVLPLAPTQIPGLVQQLKGETD